MMIETLHGIQETVHFNTNTPFKLYSNEDFESYPTHWHIPLELIMPLKNTYTVNCTHTSYKLNEGDILFIAPGVLHSMPAAPGKRLILQIDFNFLHHLKDTELVLSLLSPTLLLTSDRSPIVHSKIQYLICQIAEEYSQGFLLCEAVIYAKLIEIIALLGRNTPSGFHQTDSPRTPSKEYTKCLLPILDYMNEHYTENLSLDQVAQLSGFSKYYFSHLFKELTHDTFYQYLTKKRIEYAERLLLDDSLSITEVALNCGFSSISAFIRMFKILKHCTPTEFKNMHSV